MDDDRKNFPRKGGQRPGGRAGGRAPDAAGPDGKPFRNGGGKKRFESRDGGTGAGKRPFKPRNPVEGAAKAEGTARPFKAGPRGNAGKPFDKRPRREERNPASGEGRHEWKPRGERFQRAEGDREKHGSQRREASGEKRGFQRREGEGEKREFPRRDGSRSFGSKSHADRNFEGPKRSYGMKSHGEGAKKPFRKRPAPVAEEAGERIAKRLARAGIASRRDAEELIAAGRVSVNGRKLDSPAFNVTATDSIEVDGTAIPAIERTRLFLFHKPAGLVTTNRDPEGRKTVFDVLPADLPRLMTIGRLDINTEGLLLLTNDGGLARVLELPATGWLRRYRVRVHGKVDEKALAGLKDGIAVDGVFYGAIEASLDREQGSNAWLSIGLREGKNREVKNILGALGLDVTRLIRVSYGPFQLGDLPEGHVLEIKGRMLRDQLGERLIEEAGANFEAPIANQFPNQPVRREARPEQAERPKVQRDGERGRIGEGGLIKKRHRRENSRDEALGKLSTRPGGPGKPRREGRGEREARNFEPPKPRSSNVWMAPGARPQGRKPDAPSPKRGQDDRGPSGPRGGGKPGSGPRGKGRS